MELFSDSDLFSSINLFNDTSIGRTKKLNKRQRPKIEVKEEEDKKKIMNEIVK